MLPLLLKMMGGNTSALGDGIFKNLGEQDGASSIASLLTNLTDGKKNSSPSETEEKEFPNF